MQNHLSRTWFLGHGCKQVPLKGAKNVVRWGHPDGFFLNAQGQKVAHTWPPSQLGDRHPGGSTYPRLRECTNACHILMALAFYGERPDEAEIGVTKNRSDFVCHHLIPDKLDYRPANLLCWLTREQHAEADRRQRALKKVLGDMHILSYEDHRRLQDPRTMSREQFEVELQKLRDHAD